MNTRELKHVVMMSGGLLSWATGKRVAEKHGTENMALLFADTRGNSKNIHDGEDDSTYEFLNLAAANIGAPLVRISKGRSVWEHFFKKRMMGSSRFPICSVELKREVLDSWQDQNLDKSKCTLYFGIDWTESHRLPPLKAMRSGWNVEAPMCDAPYLDKHAIQSWALRERLPIPKLYKLGFPHNNCGGFCVKAGQAQFALLLKTQPERFKYHEDKEQEFRAMVGKDVSIMKDRRGGTTKPLTLKQLRERIESQQEFDELEWGGCGCAVE